jgi:hypothetical protein
MNSNVAVLIDIDCRRADSQITRPNCAIIVIQMIDGFVANVSQNAGDSDRKYATRPVTDRAAAICIYTLLRSVLTALDDALSCVETKFAIMCFL